MNEGDSTLYPGKTDNLVRESNILLHECRLAIKLDECLYICEQASWMNLKTYLYLITDLENHVGVTSAHLLCNMHQCSYVWVITELAPQHMRTLPNGDATKVWFLIKKTYQAKLNMILRYEMNLNVIETTCLEVVKHEHSPSTIHVKEEFSKIPLCIVSLDDAYNFILNANGAYMDRSLISGAVRHGIQIQHVGEPFNYAQLGNTMLESLFQRLRETRNKLTQECSEFNICNANPSSSRNVRHHTFCDVTSCQSLQTCLYMSIEDETFNVNEIKVEEDTFYHQGGKGEKPQVISRNLMKKPVKNALDFLNKHAHIFQTNGMVRARGPILLVECPGCNVHFKNCPDRLIRLLRHITRCHKKHEKMFIETIIERHHNLIIHMKKEVHKFLMKRCSKIVKLREMSIKGNNKSGKCQGVQMCQESQDRVATELEKVEILEKSRNLKIESVNFY